MTSRRKPKEVKAWATLKRSGTIDPGFISSVKAILHYRSKITTPPRKIVRVSIRVVK